MARNNELLSSFSYEEQLAKARFYKEDLEKGGWKVARKDQRSTFWIKTFANEEMPIKMLFEYEMPLSAEQFSEVYSPRNMEYRLKWDKAFYDNEILEEYPDNGGHIAANRVKLSWPLSDRDFVLFIPAAKEIDWCGKRAIYHGSVNASHSSKPANVGGRVRATNGGNFYIAIPGEKDPENGCRLFGLAHNNYNGWLPKSGILMEAILSRSVPATFSLFYEGIVQGHKMFFANK